MKAILFIILTLCISSLTVAAQNELPDKSTVEDIKGMTKVYTDVVNPTNAFKDAFSKAGLVSVSKAADAEFFIEYRKIGETRYISSLNIPLEEGRLTVYFYKNAKKTVVWEDTASDSGKHPSPDDKLLKRFLKDRDRVEKQKH